MLPQAAKNANGTNYELVANSEGLLSQDAKHTVKPAAQKLKDVVFKKFTSMQEEQLVLTEKVERSQESLTEKEDALAQLNAKFKKLEQKCKADKEVRTDQRTGTKGHSVESARVAHRLRGAGMRVCRVVMVVMQAADEEIKVTLSEQEAVEAQMASIRQNNAAAVAQSELELRQAVQEYACTPVVWASVCSARLSE